MAEPAPPTEASKKDPSKSFMEDERIDGSKSQSSQKDASKSEISSKTPSPEAAELPTSEKPLAGRGQRKKEILGERVTDESAGVTLIWNEISVRVPIVGGRGFKMPKLPFVTPNNYNMRVVLDRVSGVAKPGELLAIMGGSGAGKTTLLNVLTNIDQKELKKSGTVTINGQPLQADILKRISAYVQQHDIFIGTLTVREQITFSAKLRLGRRATAEEQRNRIEDVIRDFNLTNAQNTLIGVPNRTKGISLGEKKRLAIASEMFADPYLLFCDEPTSGLDAFMAKQVAIMMRDMARSGKTVITTIHQPSSEVFSMFDKVCFMAAGKIIYLGPTSEVCNFWESVGPSFACPKTFNPADHVIRTLSATSKDPQLNELRVERIRRTFEQSKFAAELQVAIHGYQTNMERASILGGRSSYAASWPTQLWALLLRSFRTTIRDPLLLKVRLIQIVVTSLIIGIVNLNYSPEPVVGDTITNMEGVLYNCARDMNFMFLFPSIQVITSELPIFRREHRSGIYSVDTYFMSKSLAEFPQYTVLPVIYSTIVYWMTGLQRKFGHFVVFAIFNTVQCHVAISMAYAGACVFGDETLALTYMNIIVLPMLVFGGFYISFHTIPQYLKWLSYFSWYRYGYAGLMSNQFGYSNDTYYDITGCKNETTNGTSGGGFCPASDTRQLMERRGMADEHWWKHLVVLISMSVFFRIVGLGSLALRVTDLKKLKNKKLSKGNK